MQSIRNKTDELRSCTQYLSEYRNSSLNCLTETQNDPDSSIDIEGFTLIKNDRTINSEKSKGGGVHVCAFVNEKNCHTTHTHNCQGKTVHERHRTFGNFSSAILHVPARETHQIRLFVVCIPPTPDINIASDTIHDYIDQAETESPEAAHFILGNF